MHQQENRKEVILMYDPLGLYLHIPFCVKKCAYCDFYSVTDHTFVERYVNALLLHMEDYSASLLSREVDTVFFGGGTPTLLGRRGLTDLLDGIRQNFNLTEDAEITVECNPATVTLADLKALKKAGFNRLSLGLQSTDDEELKLLSRVHTYEQFLETYRCARKAGFDNINIDLMYGIPDQTPTSLARSLLTVCDLQPEHISLYNLILEEGTPLYEKKDSLRLPGENEEFKMYSDAVDYLESRGYHQYEISNFAKDGYECRHNLKYWNCEEYLGLGPAAHSYLGGRRFSFKRDIEAYIRALESPDEAESPIDENYDVKPEERIGEYVMLAMRLKDGVDTRKFAETFGRDFEQTYGKYLKLYVEHGFMTHKGSRYAFTLKGMYVSNYILSSMIDFEGGIANGVADGTDKV